MSILGKKKFVFCFGNMNQLFLFSAIQKTKDKFFDLIDLILLIHTLS